MKRLSVLFLSIFLLSGCDNVQLTETYKLMKLGDNIVRLNSKTGEMLLLNESGDTKRVGREYIDSPGVGSVSSNLKTIKKTFPGSVEMFLTTNIKWRNNYLLYQCSFGPYDKNLAAIFDGKNKGAFADPYNDSNSFKLIFKDPDGFEVVRHTINPAQRTTYRAAENWEDTAYWRVDGKFICSEALYMAIKDIGCIYSFSKELTEALSMADKKLKNRKEND